MSFEELFVLQKNTLDLRRNPIFEGDLVRRRDITYFESFDNHSLELHVNLAREFPVERVCAQLQQSKSQCSVEYPPSSLTGVRPFYLGWGLPVVDQMIENKSATMAVVT